MSRKNPVIAMIVITLILSIGLIGCQPKSSDQPVENTNESVEWSWSKNSDCTACHTIENDSYEDTTCYASLHKEVACMQCHSDESTLQEVHGDVSASDTKGTKRLKTTEIDSTVCIGCHGNLNELAVLTEECTILTDDNGMVVNPHALSKSESHEDQNCSNCHKMHTRKSANETAPQYCESCHHAKVYECGTCHE